MVYRYHLPLPFRRMTRTTTVLFVFSSEFKATWLVVLAAMDLEGKLRVVVCQEKATQDLSI